jgi:uncharacterized damage-inducible protein DinB
VSRPILADAFAHHVWATDKLLEVCEALDTEQLATSVPGTYGSIIETLRHTVGADASYLALLSEGRVSDVDEYGMDVAALRAAMRALEPVWQWLVAQDLDPDLVIVRHREDGSTSTAPLGVRLAQAIHHGTDHRSQVCTALTTLGIEPPEIDVWAWADAQGKLAETPPTAGAAG